VTDGVGSGHASEIAHASLRGAVAAAAMTGMRAFTVDAGLVEQTPPQAIAKQRAKGLLRRVPRGRRRAAIELAHWTYGAVGGAAYAVLPPGYAQKFAGGINGTTRVQTIAGAGHLAYLDQPEAVARAVLEHLS